MPILIDGNNLLHRLPAEHRSREGARTHVLDVSRRERMAVTLVFDGPPPEGRPAEEHLGRVTVVYSGSAIADDVIVGRIPSGPAARSWTVVTDDRALVARIRERGASARPVQQWITRKGAPAKSGKPRPEPRVKDLKQWEAFFDRDASEEDEPRRVLKAKRPGKPRRR